MGGAGLFQALFEPVKPVVNIGFVLLQKRGNGGGGKAGCRKKKEHVIFLFHAGKIGLQLVYNAI